MSGSMSGRRVRSPDFPGARIPGEVRSGEPKCSCSGRLTCRAAVCRKADEQACKAGQKNPAGTIWFQRGLLWVGPFRAVEAGAAQSAVRLLFVTQVAEEHHRDNHDRRDDAGLWYDKIIDPNGSGAVHKEQADNLSEQQGHAGQHKNCQAYAFRVRGWDRRMDVELVTHRDSRPLKYMEQFQQMLCAAVQAEDQAILQWLERVQSRENAL